jgi:1-deoxy-D-xylulose-5-phosphate reductoisomerase
LAWTALSASEGTTAVLNASNEVAVAAFLDRRIRYDQIHHVNLETLGGLVPHKPRVLEDLLDIDRSAREVAESAVARMRV